MAIGFQILKRKRKVAADIVDRFRGLPVANVSDQMSRLTAGGARLRPMHKGGAMAGPALTVRTRPGDNLMLHKALDLAEPGDVIVCDGGGDLTNSLIGELMISHAIRRRVAGIVINGAIRDSDWVRARDFPVFAAGVTHRGPYKDGPGEINVAIAIDGMVIEPGDLVLGDGDGMLVVPFPAVDGVLKSTLAKKAAEEKQMAEIEAGTIDRSWVDATLKRLGCHIET
jgi:regulator of RNase E activity RraA